MKIRTLKTSLATLAVVVMGATLASMLVPVSASAGSWREVCCGAMCVGGEDYCLGNGDKTCCKALED